FEKVYLAKVFIGSFGHRVLPNDYAIFYSPEGTNTNEFDHTFQRDVPTLPYGYIIGKLGQRGDVFPIGTNYQYSFQDNAPIRDLIQQNSVIESD
ncbi:MAG: hypothetical protein MJB14_11805, partial [Spirochaetes bacterium]|nr:hypothetical protein [Spirochaetota bacterium]